MRYRTVIAALIFCCGLLSQTPLFAQATVDFLVNWEPNPEPSVTGYVIFRSLDRDSQFSAIDSVDANTFSYRDSGVLAGTRYYYRLLAKDNGNRSALSNPMSGIVIRQDASEPEKDACRITDLDRVVDGTYNISWSSLNSTIGFVQYDLDASLDSTSNWDLQYSLSHTNQIGGLIVPETYYVRAVSYDSDDNMIISCMDTLVVTPSPPSQPTGFAATDQGGGCVLLNWNINPEQNIVDYTVYRANQSVEQGVIASYTDSIPNITGNSHFNCGLPEGVYYYALRARNSAGILGPLSAEASVIVNPVTQPPAPPQQVEVLGTDPGCVRVTWRANSEPDLAGYYVYYGDQSVPSEAPAYTDSIHAETATELENCGLTNGDIFYFAVKAYNAAGQFSGYSQERNIEVPSLSPPHQNRLRPGPR